MIVVRDCRPQGQISVENCIGRCNSLSERSSQQEGMNPDSTWHVLMQLEDVDRKDRSLSSIVSMVAPQHWHGTGAAILLPGAILP
jgi:hypothetical protein